MPVQAGVRQGHSAHYQIFSGLVFSPPEFRLKTEYFSIFVMIYLSSISVPDGVSNGILPVTNNDANLVFFVLFTGIFPALTRKALGTVRPFYGPVDTLHHGISSCFSASSSRQDTQSDTCKTGSTGLRVGPFELVEMVVEHRD